MRSHALDMATARLSDSESPIGKGHYWTGWALSGLVAAFLAVDGIMKLVKPEVVIKATVELGYPESSIVGIGLVLLVSTFFYVYPRTSAIGGLLLTGYLGGAVAAHVRVGANGNLVMPILFGVFLWAGLWLRVERVRRVLRQNG